MAIEGVDPSVTPEIGDQGSTGSPASTGSTGSPAPDTKAWDAERAGFLRDLQSERQKRQAYEGQIAQHKADLEREQRRVRAMAGIDTPSADAQEAEQIKARFAQLYPDLAGLTADDVKALRDWKTQSGVIQETQQAMWRDKARVMTQAVESRIAKELGGDLTPRQIKNIRAAYVAAAEADPQFLARHEQGDLKLADEFASQFIEDWFAPARRKVTEQQVSQMRRVPGGGNRSVPGSTAPKIDVNDPKAVEDFLLQGRKERGEGFGRR